MAFPNVVDRASGGTGANQGYITMPIPGAAQVGDMLIFFYSHRHGGTDTWPAGWVSLLPNVNPGQHTTESRYKYLSSGDIATGSVTVTYTNNGPTSWVSYLIPNAAAIESSGWVGPSTADPPNLTPSWGSDDTLWLAFCTAFTAGPGGGNWSGQVTAYPSGYGNTMNPLNSESGVGAADRQLAAASENPSSFSWLDGPYNGLAATIAVRNQLTPGDKIEVAMLPVRLL